MEGDYTPQQVAELHSEQRIQLIDVRQPHEHFAGNGELTPRGFVLEESQATGGGQRLQTDHQPTAQPAGQSAGQMS